MRGTRRVHVMRRVHVLSGVHILSRIHIVGVIERGVLVLARLCRAVCVVQIQGVIIFEKTGYG